VTPSLSSRAAPSTTVGCALVIDSGWIAIFGGLKPMIIDTGIGDDICRLMTDGTSVFV
jgi:hypothetical protein